MGDNHRCTTLQKRCESLLHQLLALGIECRGSLVKNQNLGVTQHRTGNAQSLTLTTRELHTSVAHIGVVSRLGLHNEVVGIGNLRRRNNLLLGGILTSHSYVGTYGVVEENSILRHDTHLLAQALLRIVRQRLAVDRNLTHSRVVEARYKLTQGRFTTTRRTHQRNGLALANGERHIVQHLA